MGRPSTCQNAGLGMPRVASSSWTYADSRSGRIVQKVNFSARFSAYARLATPYCTRVCSVLPLPPPPPPPPPPPKGPACPRRHDKRGMRWIPHDGE